MILKKYNFFKWYEKFICPRAPKCNALSSMDSQEEKEKMHLDDLGSLQKSDFGEEGQED